MTEQSKKISAIPGLLIEKEKKGWSVNEAFPGHYLEMVYVRYMVYTQRNHRQRSCCGI